MKTNFSFTSIYQPKLNGTMAHSRCWQIGFTIKMLILKSNIMEVKVLKYVFSKGKNKRINIQLIEREDGEKIFIVETKTLNDFKSRNILKTHNVYSVETFTLLSQFMSLFLNDSEISNKLIHNEIYKIKKFSAHSNINSARSF